MKPAIQILLFLFCTHASASHATSKTLVERLRFPAAGAHQGGLFKLRPNTLKQFKYAINKGVDVLETDLRLTKDGVAIVFHDKTLNRATWNCRGPVAQKTFGQIKKCRLISGDKIPTYEQLLLMVNGRAVINAEFKADEVIGPALKIMKKYNAYEWTYFQAKNQKQYLHARETDPMAHLLLRIRTDKELNWALSFPDERMLLIEVDKWMLKPSYVNRIHHAGKLVTSNVWRLSNHNEILGAECQKGWDLGIDVVISNSTTRCVEQKKNY